MKQKLANYLEDLKVASKDMAEATVEMILVISGISILIIFGLSVVLTKDEKKEKTAAPAKVTETVAEAPDMTPLVYVGVAVGVLIFIAIAIGVVAFILKTKRNAIELKRKTQELDAERTKALGLWGRYVDEHNAIKEKALSAEIDWDMLFSYPALTDMSVPQTAAFHRALKAADLCSSEPPVDINLSMDLAVLPYPKAVSAAGEAWGNAYDFARKVGLKLVPRSERKKIDQIIKLLKLAREGNGSEHERNLAYERVAKLASELQFVRVPARALQALTSESRLILEAAPQGAVKVEREEERLIAL